MGGFAAHLPRAKIVEILIIRQYKHNWLKPIAIETAPIEICALLEKDWGQ